MKICLTCSILLFIQFQLFSQQVQNILAFDFKSEGIDTIPILDFDETISKENTPHFIGQYDNEIADLETEFPTENLFDNGEYTELEKANPKYDSENFPLRTTVNIFSVENGVFEQICSGNMVSRKHVLTSGFCFLEEYDFINNIFSLKTDSLVIFPALDNGMTNESFPCATVIKGYLMEDAIPGISDMALLELDFPIGEQTGWLGIGFNENEEELKENVYYKFSYPNNQFLSLNDRIYFGDTMYYRYGKVDLVNSNNTFVMSGFGRQGEGGSNLIQVKNNSSFTSFGTLGYSVNLRHTNFKKESYFGFRQIIRADLSTPSAKTSLVFRVFPNPTTDVVNFQFYKKHKNITMRLIDPLGRVIRESKLSDDTQQLKIDMRFFDRGSYFLQLETDTDLGTVQFIKL